MVPRWLLLFEFLLAEPIAPPARFPAPLIMPEYGSAGEKARGVKHTNPYSHSMVAGGLEEMS
jgi:hypothetical protein